MTHAPLSRERMAQLSWQLVGTLFVMVAVTSGFATLNLR